MQRQSRLLALFLLLVLIALVAPVLWAVLRLSVAEFDRFGGASGFTFAHFVSVARDLKGAGRLVAFTLGFSAGASLLGFGLGTSLAWLVARTDMPFKGFVETAAIVKLTLPGLIYSVAWLLLLSPRGILGPLVRAVSFDVFSLPGMILIEGFLLIPLSYFLMVALFSSQDASLEEASYTAGVTPLRTAWHITMPLAVPGMLSVIMLSLVRTLEAFEVPAIIGLPGGVRTFVSEIYSDAKLWPPNYGRVGVYSVILMIMLALALRTYVRFTREAARFHTVAGKAGPRRYLRLGKYRLLTGVGVVALLSAVIYLPLLVLVWASVSPYYAQPSWEGLGQVTMKNYAALMNMSRVPISFANSLMLATGAAIVVVILASLVAWVVMRGRVPGSRALETLATFPVAFPGVVTGVALAQFYLVFPLPIYGTHWILLIAYVIAFLPFGMRYALPAMLQIHGELEEAAHISGVSWTTTLVRIVLPLIKTALIGAGLLVFMASFRELARSALLYSSDTVVASVALLELWTDGQLTQVAAYSVVVSGLLLVVALLARKLGGSLKIH